jgi:hypothetical protein
MCHFQELSQLKLNLIQLQQHQKYRDQGQKRPTTVSKETYYGVQFHEHQKHRDRIKEIFEWCKPRRNPSVRQLLQNGGFPCPDSSDPPGAQRRCHPEEALYLPTFSHLFDCQ